MIKGCKYCGRSGSKIFTKSGTGQIQKEKCIYCNGKGYVNEDKKEVENAILE